MNAVISDIDQQAWKYANQHGVDEFGGQDTILRLKLYRDKLAELIVKACADAADMAHDAQCEYPGDYVGEQMGYGAADGISVWRYKLE